MTSKSLFNQARTHGWLERTLDLSRQMQSLTRLPQQCGSMAVTDLDDLAALLEEAANRAESVLSLLTLEEQVLFQRFQYAKRRKEWLGGRISAKVSLCAFHGQAAPRSFSSWRILPDEHGRPLSSSRMAVSRPCSISITHSSGYAAAMTSASSRCGLDLQKKSDRLIGLTSYFTGKQEEALANRFLAHRDRITRLTMIWSAKEAVKKALLSEQSTIFERIAITEITDADAHEAAPAPCRFRCQVTGTELVEVTVHLLDLGDFVLAWCSGGDHA